MKILFTIIMITLLAVGTVYAGPDFSGVEMKTSSVNGTVYMIQGAGGNIGICAGEDGIIMVDDEFAPLAEKVVCPSKS